MAVLDVNILKDIRLAPCQNFVDNKFQKGHGPVLPLVNPKDESSIPVAGFSATQEDVDTAVRCARNQFERGAWSKWTGAQRAQALNKLADLMVENTEVLAHLESTCSGKILSMMRDEIARAAETFRYYAGWADKIRGDSYPADDGFYKIVRKEPLGVCCGILAWNASIMFCAWKSAPALAAGNTMIFKPSEKSFLGTLALAQLYEAAGFPPGVVQVVIGGRDVGAILSSHMDIDKISFTGSTFAGRKIQEAAAKSNLKRVTLELGGKGPAIVFDDADLDTAVFWVNIGFTVNTGQVCASTSRLFLQRSIAETFLSKLKAALSPLQQNIGADPLDPLTVYGPLVDKAQFDEVRGYIEEGKKVTTVLTADSGSHQRGFYVAPTVFLDPKPDEKIWNEEIFGPVLCVRIFDTEDEALQLANDTEYGLSGAVFTKDIKRALRISSNVRTGTVGVNCNIMVGNQVPLGGFKASGVGRELGEYGLAQYTETKTVWINMN